MPSWQAAGIDAVAAEPAGNAARCMQIPWCKRELIYDRKLVLQQLLHWVTAVNGWNCSAPDADQHEQHYAMAWHGLVKGVATPSSYMTSPPGRTCRRL
jgi:hypothetical protein